jgi:hypothetical protein
MSDKRFELIMDYEDEIGIMDNESGDVIVLQTSHSANSIGFCSGVCNLLNVLNEQNELLNRKNEALTDANEGLASTIAHGLGDMNG